MAQPSLSSTKTAQQQTVAELAEFAAHMVCYLLYGHQPKSPSCATSSPTVPSVGASPRSMPSSPRGTTQGCLCDACNNTTTHRTNNQSNSGSPVVYAYPTWQHPNQTQDQTSAAAQKAAMNHRPTHRRIVSESEIVQPKPMFRKFCLDVLSATLLSPSVILLSLKYIRKLMLNLKSSNKVVNTGEGAEYRFFTGALILANKFLDDNTFTNKTWADITGMKIKDVNHLEMQFLSGIDFKLFTSPSEYQEWLASLTQFTGQYMPSQHQVAHQQQTTAARSPISPVDTASVDFTSQQQQHQVAPAPVLAPMSVRHHHHHHHQGSIESTSVHSIGGNYTQQQSQAPMPLSMASISNYIDSVKLIQHKAVSGSQFQRVPATTTSTAVPSSIYRQTHTPANSIDGQHPSLHYPVQTQTQTQQHHHFVPSPVSTTRPGSFYGQGSTLAPYTHSPVTPGSFSYHQNPPPVHRKRSANIAFEDTMEHSPAFGPGASLPSSSRAMAVRGRAHKRFSSSSSAIALMGQGSDQDMFRGGYSPIQSHQPQQQQQQQQQQQMAQYLPSVGNTPTFVRGHHQRSSSGGFYMDMARSEYSSLVPLQEPVRGQFSGSNHPVHPLEVHHQMSSSQEPVYRSSSRLSGSFAGMHLTPQDARSQQHHQVFDLPVTPSYHGMGSRNGSFSGYGGSPDQGRVFEVDPRLWGPIDSMSLYAITTQAAKRVVAQSKALSSSVNNLHMYYPTTLA
ncbi:hypothetical protein BGZ83_011265 [Gryganskiella cystojenkinii]|nr:hypothetical protein BGZ83_011265 [Gryganskiella cystojenkinii]